MSILPKHLNPYKGSNGNSRRKIHNHYGLNYIPAKLTLKS